MAAMAATEVLGWLSLALGAEDAGAAEGVSGTEDCDDAGAADADGNLRRKLVISQ